MFILLSILLAIYCGGFALLVHYLRRGRCVKLATALPRWRYPGVILGVICLIWSAYHGCLMLEGSLARFHALVWWLVPITASLSYFYLDYLLARASGGFLTLMANELLNQGFAQQVCCRPLYSAVCLVIGVVGLCQIGIPWRLRDTLELTQTKPRFAAALQWFLTFCALVLIVLPLIRKIP